MDKVDSRQEQKGIVNRHGNPKKKFFFELLEAKHCNSKRKCFSFNNTLDVTNERISEFLQSKGLSRVFSNTTVQKHQFLGAQPSSQSNSHIHT